MTDKRFEQIREGIYQELLKANQHFKICWGIKRASKNIVKGRNVHLTFFYYTMRANDDRFCLAIYNVIKPDKGTANFTKLFNYIRSNHLSIFEKNEIDQMEETIQSHAYLIKRIKSVRDQYIAHVELKKENIQEKFTYTYEEGRQLIADLNKILSDLSSKYDNSGYWSDAQDDYLFGVIPTLDIEAVLHSLTEHYNDRSKRLDHQTI